MQPLKQDDAIIGTWRDEILSNPNAYIISRIGEVESKPKFGPFDVRLKHPQIQKDMIPLVAQGIAEATTWIAFLPTTDKKIHTLNSLITYYKNYKKSTWKDKQETKDDKIKKITAIEIFTIMYKDLRNRLQMSADTRRPSLFETTFSKKSKPLTFLLPSYKGPGDEIGNSELGGSKRKTKQRKIKKTRKTRKSRTLKKRALK